MKLLFVCNQNKNRSKTAEEIFKSRYETRSAGLFNEIPLNSGDLEWADVVAVMEEKQRKEISLRFPKEYMKKKIINLDIPDIYSFRQPELIKRLNDKLVL
jgi:predicted protein tyrosine phosphatase